MTPARVTEIREELAGLRGLLEGIELRLTRCEKSAATAWALLEGRLAGELDALRRHKRGEGGG